MNSAVKVNELVLINSLFWVQCSF